MWCLSAEARPLYRVSSHLFASSASMTEQPNPQFVTEWLAARRAGDDQATVKRDLKVARAWLIDQLQSPQ
jgi:hypothetical protein